MATTNKNVDSFECYNRYFGGINMNRPIEKWKIYFLRNITCTGEFIEFEKKLDMTDRLLKLKEYLKRNTQTFLCLMTAAYIHGPNIISEAIKQGVFPRHWCH